MTDDDKWYSLTEAVLMGGHAKVEAVMAERDRARAIAVALEQENAHLARQVAELLTVVAGLSDQDGGDIVGQEGLPLGDPWLDSPIPNDWREDE